MPTIPALFCPWSGYWLCVAIDARTARYARLEPTAAAAEWCGVPCGADPRLGCVLQRGKAADKGKGKFSEQEVQAMQDVD